MENGYCNARRAAALLAAALIAGACATAGTRDFETAKGSWTGARFDEVVAQWGAPTRSTRLQDGSEVHTWVSETSTARPGPAVGVGIFGGSGGTGVGVGAGFPIGGSGAMVRCERTLVFRGERLVEQTWSGSPDYCASFARR